MALEAAVVAVLAARRAFRADARRVWRLCDETSSAEGFPVEIRPGLQLAIHSAGEDTPQSKA